MKIELAEKAGFCFGVDRAVKMAYELAKTPGNHACFGMLIHNRDVTEDLAGQGLPVLETIEEIPSGIELLIRAHGIPKAEQEALEAKEVRIVDATCPYVKKIHRIVEKAHEAGRQVIICGDASHPEVKGIHGWCENSAKIIGREDEIEEITNLDAEIPLTVVAQTTIRADFFKKITEKLKKHFTNVEIFDTICNATAERQKAAADLAARCDCMLVVGGKNSSNTRKLFEV